MDRKRGRQNVPHAANQDRDGMGWFCYPANIESLAQDTPPLLGIDEKAEAARRASDLFTSTGPGASHDAGFDGARTAFSSTSGSRSSSASFQFFDCEMKELRQRSSELRLCFHRLEARSQQLDQEAAKREHAIIVREQDLVKKEEELKKREEAVQKREDQLAKLKEDQTEFKTG